MLLQAFSPAALDLYAIRSQQIVRISLQDWCKAYNIKTYAKCRELTFQIACEVLLGFQLTADERCSMLDDFQIYVDSVFSLPFNVPVIGFGRVSVILLFSELIYLFLISAFFICRA